MTDFVSKGSLRYHLLKNQIFTETQTKFVVACVLLALEYIHTNGVIHRDIKPENLGFDEKGYVRLVNFGIARILSPDNFRDSSGTPGYMAPEVMKRQNHGWAVDYYALGIVAYECMLGCKPYKARNRNEIKEKIISREIQLQRYDVPTN